MKRIIWFGFFLYSFLFTSIHLSAQNLNSTRFILSGQVRNVWTGEPFAGVNIFIPSIKVGTTTDNNGYYSLSLDPGTYRITFSRIDLNSEVVTIDIITDKQFNLEMREKTFTLQAVDVFSEREDAQIKNLDVGKNILSIEKITTLPTFMGETDVVKSLMLLPGVSTVGEGASGFNVRGGGVDQNLILQDGGLIFNPSHVFGFFSSFNPAAVSKASLYKGGLPSKYGGRLSSVLDVDVKEGDFQNYNATGSIGLVSAKLAIDGPILKQKLSFMFASRLSYSDWLLTLAENPMVKNSSAGFQDFNAKLTYRHNKSKVYYSGYLSRDNFALASDTAFAWSTFNNTIKWTYNLSEKIAFNVDVTSGNYKYTIRDNEGFNSFDIVSNINYQKGRFDVIYDISEQNSLNIGLESIFYRFKPGEQRPLSDQSGVEKKELETEKSLESSLYIEDEIKITEKFSVRGGVRVSDFRNYGAGSDFIYSSGSKSNDNIIDTVFYSNNELISHYNGIEPRLTLNYNLSSVSSIKFGYTRTKQYLHLITNTAAVTPTDLWKTSNKYIKPQVGDQYSLGYFNNFFNNKLEVSIEGYYKTADNIVDFKDGSVLLMNPNIEADLIQGTSQGYGVEFFINKKYGNLTGWMSYTYSRIFRTVNGFHDDEKLNNGKAYPANNDKPHDVSFTLNYKTTPIVEYGANFTYSTGRPQTAPLSIYDISNLNSVFNYSQRNQKRIPDYHRLDVSVTVNSKPKIDRKWKVSWTLAVYNLYGRKNAFSVFYENKYGSPPKAYKLSVLGSAFPSLMINFKF